MCNYFAHVQNNSFKTIIVLFLKSRRGVRVSILFEHWGGGEGFPFLKILTPFPKIIVCFLTEYLYWWVRHPQHP